MSECCEPGQWASWQEMTSCPQTCGSFVQQRSRSCRAVRADRRCAEAAMPLEQRIEQMCPSPKPCGTPVCITSCSDVKDGVYPSCSSCTDYIRCDARRARVMRCSPAGFEFNSETKRCSEPPSATCTYKAVECDEDGSHQRGGQCDAMWRCRDGQLLDLWRCPSGLSFDLRTLTCVSQSSTCVDSVIRTHILEDLIPDVQSIIGGSIQPF
ncbi:chondroitin proteoglycan-2 [Aplysia californica]|uniref:Chondroitin proteoglycan-2 n=1 Tax=Aplysia californica TaxID=6500 RepID=A0ABM0JWX6_APLCA|nr:chondroitin proteoglycan-2 [Aplysia californica]